MPTIFVLKFSVIVSFLYFSVDGLNAPTFESSWVTLTAQATAESQLVIPHDLGEYPVKVDVQIRVLDNGSYYIFTGSGSAHRDDDLPSSYGGVVYIYNAVDIRVYAPVGQGSLFAGRSGLVAFTGGAGTTGSTLIGGSYISGEVKVRAWALCDIGPPAFSHQWTNISSASAYHQISHNLGVYPDLVTVQVALDSTDYWSDAQGSAGISDNVRAHIATGGVLFGYDTTMIRLWASSKGYVFSAFDGWGLNEDWRFASGQIRIICWTFPATEILFEHTLTMGIGLTSSYEIAFSSTFETDDILMSTEITVADGNNPGFRFYGTGNSLTDGSVDAFGGVAYAYTETQILLWRPSDSSGGKMVYHDGIWAGGQMNQMSDTAQVTIRIMTATGSVTGGCGHGSCSTSLDPVNVTCTCDPNWTDSDCKTAVTTTTTQTTTTTTVVTTTPAPTTTTNPAPTTTVTPVATATTTSVATTTTTPVATTSSTPAPTTTTTPVATTTTTSVATTTTTPFATTTTTPSATTATTPAATTTTPQTTRNTTVVTTTPAPITTTTPVATTTTTLAATTSTTLAATTTTTPAASTSTALAATTTTTPAPTTTTTPATTTTTTPAGTTTATSAATTTTIPAPFTATTPVATTTTTPAATTTTPAPTTTTTPGTTPIATIAAMTTTVPAVTSAMCGVPTAVANTDSLYDGTSGGSNVLYSCNTGYALSSGDQKHTCVAGAWVGNLPVCLACSNTFTPVITTSEALNERLETLKKNTELSAKNTSSYKRSLVCAYDPRPSSLHVGTIGIIMLN